MRGCFSFNFLVVGAALVLGFFGSRGAYAQYEGQYPESKEMYFLRKIDRQVGELSRKIDEIDRKLENKGSSQALLVDVTVDVPCLQKVVGLGDSYDSRLNSIESCRSADLEELKSAGCLVISRKPNTECFGAANVLGYSAAQRGQLMESCQSYRLSCS